MYTTTGFVIRFVIGFIVGWVTMDVLRWGYRKMKARRAQ